jgi:hypothetical protein
MMGKTIDFVRGQRDWNNEKCAEQDEMRVYHFLQADHAHDDLRNGHVKVATINDLNDPFEALSCALPTRADRQQFRGIKNRIHDAYGILCFSAGWSNPVLWSHYADRHSGICLGFDVPSQSLMQVQYTDKRDDLTPGLIRRSDVHCVLLRRKYHDWQYEREWRMILPLNALVERDGMFFKKFDSTLRLREIFVGPMGSDTPSQLRSGLHPIIQGVSFIKARMAFRSFRIVMNRQGFKGTDTRRAQSGPRD